MNTDTITLTSKNTNNGKNLYLGKIRIGSYWYHKLTRDAKKI